ncbi:transposase [Mesorhizobium sp. M0309]|uniref:transposase DNA-binding-containing protein n=1 Tax=Mesorhizobium sp. M0309 TaxID=2956933 RepID=UPI00333957A7
MRDKTSSGEAAWQEAELSTAALPTSVWPVGCDGCWIRCQLRRASQSRRCGDRAAAKATYRFFDNPRVTEHGVLAGHFAATAARVAAS